MMNKMLRRVEYDSPFGSKSIELWCADITAQEFPADVFIISAYAGDHRPSASSIIGALASSFGISVKDLSEDPELDARRDLGVWISREIDTPVKRVACIESSGSFQERHESYPRLLENLLGMLAIMNIRGMRISTVVLPILGTGEQGISVELVIPVLVSTIQKAFSSISDLDRVILVDKSEEKVVSASGCIDGLFGRTSSDTEPLRSDPTATNIIEEAITLAMALARRDLTGSGATELSQLVDALKSGDASFVTIAPAARKALEYHLGRKSGERIKNVAEAIEKLRRSKTVAPWVTENMSVIKAYGNYAVHSTSEEKYRPRTIKSGDRLLMLHALVRFLEYWNTVGFEP